VKVDRSGPLLRVDRDADHPLVLSIVVCAIAVGVFALMPPVRELFDLLFSGDRWTATIGVGLILLLPAIVLLGASVRSPGLRRLGELTLVASLACVVIGLVGTGWVVDAVRWLGDAVPKIREFLS
jgi:hypothetical protein